MGNKSKAVFRKSGKASFDPKNFLAKVGGGKTALKCERDEIVFLQGDWLLGIVDLFQRRAAICLAASSLRVLPHA